MQNRLIMILLAVAGVMVALAAFYTTSERVTAQNAESPALTREDVEGVVAEFIKNHPEAIIASLEEYQRKMWVEEMQKRVKNMKESEGKLLGDPDSPVAGNREGDVAIVEFFDYNCGYCKHMVDTIAALLKEDPKVKVVFKEFPILTHGMPTDYSRIAAKASLAVYRLAPEKYFEFHQSVMKYASRPTEEALLGIASGLSIDGEALKAEMAKPEIDAELKEVEELAKSLGVSGTPAMVVNGELIPGAVALDQLKGAIAKARSGDKPAGEGAAPAAAPPAAAGTGAEAAPQPESPAAEGAKE